MMCSDSFSRSAPPTATPSRFRARMISWKRALRRRTRIRKSPATQGLDCFGFWRSSTASPRPIMALIERAIRRASLRPALSAGGASTGAQGSGSGEGSVISSGQASTLPPGSRRATWRTGRRTMLPGSAGVSPASAAGSANTWSTKASTSGAERQLSNKDTRSNRAPAFSTIASNAWPSAANRSGAAPWKLKIDCFSSPTANTVRSRRTAPAPTKNSPLRARRMSHWSGAVSWASSSRMCSRPPSSL